MTHPDVVFEDVGGGFGGHHVIDDQLAEGGQEVASLVQLLDLGVLVLLLCGRERSGKVGSGRSRTKKNAKSGWIHVVQMIPH